jgi:large subunit ribosomal protein L13
MKTQSFRKADQPQTWYVVDATDQVLGRLATRVASVLRGKHKPTYTPHEDLGDHVVVVNAGKVRLTGKKWTDKLYRHHTGYVGGLKEATAAKVREKDPTRLVTTAVQGMLPKSRLGRAMAKKLKVYAGADHPHAAQKPAPLAVGGGAAPATESKS